MGCTCRVLPLFPPGLTGLSRRSSARRKLLAVSCSFPLSQLAGAQLSPHVGLQGGEPNLLLSDRAPEQASSAPVDPRSAQLSRSGLSPFHILLTPLHKAEAGTVRRDVWKGGVVGGRERAEILSHVSLFLGAASSWISPLPSRASLPASRSLPGVQPSYLPPPPYLLAASP